MEILSFFFLLFIIGLGGIILVIAGILGLCYIVYWMLERIADIIEK